MVNEKATEIEAKLTSQDVSVIDVCVDMAKDLVGYEQSLSESVDAKANNLLGFAGIIAALTIDVSGLIQSVSAKNHCASVALGILYAMMLGTIFATIWYSFGGRGRSVTARPNMDDILEFQKLDGLEAKRKWLSNLISSYKITVKNVNHKVTLVYTAQQYLTIALLLLIATIGIGLAAILLP